MDLGCCKHGTFSVGGVVDFVFHSDDPKPEYSGSGQGHIFEFLRVPASGLGSTLRDKDFAAKDSERDV